MNKSSLRQITSAPKYIAILFALFLTSFFISGCVTGGSGGTAISGSAGGSESIDANTTLEHCDQTLGTIAIDDGRDSTWYHDFYRRTNVTTIEPLIRLAVQQSNCFAITSIGNLRTDDRLRRITDIQRNSGEYRAGSKQQKGQRIAADYYLEPQIVIDNSAIGGVAASAAALLGNNFGSLGNSIASIGGGFDTKSSVVTLSLTDIRSSLQISISEGSATASNYGAALGFFGGNVNTKLKGYTTTPEGKATVAAFLDSYNGMVRSLKNYKAQNVEGGLGRGGALKVN
jgi:hypothetical protein